MAWVEAGNHAGRAFRRPKALGACCSCPSCCGISRQAHFDWLAILAPGASPDVGGLYQHIETTGRALRAMEEAVATGWPWRRRMARRSRWRFLALRERGVRADEPGRAYGAEELDRVWRPTCGLAR